MSKSNENKGLDYITGCMLVCVVLSILYASFVIGEATGGLSIGIAATVAAACLGAAVLVGITVRKVAREMRGLRMDRERLYRIVYEIVKTDERLSQSFKGAGSMAPTDGYCGRCLADSGNNCITRKGGIMEQSRLDKALALAMDQGKSTEAVGMLLTEIVDLRKVIAVKDTALMVFLTDPTIKKWLRVNDPMAVQQATNAVGGKVETIPPKVAATATDTIHGMLVYFESHSAVSLSVALWPDKPIGYQETWENRFAKSLVYAWENMDSATRRRFVAIALDWYQFETTKKGVITQ